VAYERELEGLLQDRLSPHVKQVDGQDKIIRLRSLVKEEVDLASALVQKIEERQKDVQTLTQEKQKSEAGVLVEEVMATYPDVLAAFAHGIPTAEAWLKKAHEAQRAYSACHPGLGAMNTTRILSQKVELVVLVLRIIEQKR